MSKHFFHRGWIPYFLAQKRDRLFKGGDYFKYCSTGSHVLNILYITPLKWKSDHIKSDFGLFKSSKFGLLSNLQCQYPGLQSLNCHSDQFCQIRLNFNLAGKDGKRGAGAIIQGGKLFKIFPTKRGDYLREVINSGTAIIRGNMVFMSAFLEY